MHITRHQQLVKRTRVDSSPHRHSIQIVCKAGKQTGGWTDRWMRKCVDWMVELVNE